MTGPGIEYTSDDGTTFEPFDFDNEGKWNDDEQIGPAIHAPPFVKNIHINGYRVEWLSISDPENFFFAKNDMVATLVFSETQNMGGQSYKSARLSMELGREGRVVQLAAQVFTYYHSYTIDLLKYDEATNRSAHERSFLVQGGLTVGSFSDAIIERKMHHFVFLPYTSEGRWKGCGDHAVHCWAVFVREGYLVSGKSIEGPERPFSDELTTTYLLDSRSTVESVGRGWWVSHNPVEDHLVPETIFT
ncbi:hypothetical protein C8J57DRAFT_1549877, partial [Mycena rebaudengoi]